MSKYIRIAFACNNPDNGSATGYVEHIYVGDDIELEGPRTRCYRVDNGTWKVGRHQYPIVGGQSWYGNWCREAVWMREADAQRLLVRLCRRGWDCLVAPTTFYEEWETAQKELAARA